MEAIVVYTIAHSDFQALLPLIHIARSVTCEWEYKSVMLSSQERFASVYKQLSVDMRKCDKSECSVVDILAALQSQAVNIAFKLVPELSVFKLELSFKRIAVSDYTCL